MRNVFPMMTILALLAACSATTGTGGGGVADSAASATDVAFAAQDVDAQPDAAADALDVTAAVKDAPDVQAAANDCASCVSDDECATGWFCAQFQGSSFCARDCATATCTSGHACVVAPSTAGDQLKVCVPIVNPCGGSSQASDAGPTDTGSPGDINGLTCGSLVGPDLTSCCKCAAGKTCATNGCYGGWFCNAASCKCNAAPAPASCGPDDAGSTDSGPVATDVATPDSSSIQSIGTGGGTLSSLDFAIVGDTRPPSKDDIKNYPTAVITKIFQDVQAENPPVPFVVTTGDYQFSSPNGSTAAPQIDTYLQAQANYAGTVFHTMGNHECTGAVVSNCGTGNLDGTPTTYKTFMQKMMTPLGVSQPWYVVNVDATDNSWSAKFVFIAANAWSSTQATWLDAAMAKPTTYTFVVRHEGVVVTDAPGVTPSAAIIAKYPYTLLLVGHTHTFDYYSKDREVITGNGGAPLAAGVNYGYTVVRQRADKAMEVHAYDYLTHATIQTFAVKPDGTPTK